MQSPRLHLRPTGLMGRFFVAESTLSGINIATQLSCFCLLFFCFFGGLFGGGGEEGERETDLLLPLYSCFHWFLPFCALTRPEPETMAYPDDALSQLSHPARAPLTFLLIGIWNMFFFLFFLTHISIYLYT